ncbi:hypothetical protein SEPCBS119000_004243 [Sporothrix epigloea]|uniref:Peptidase S53 domain-containing protein n=1 Tax=Sporothrix epigloea TaxID=1892477 RepID=A0ABP0DR28_9PEZI
MLFNTLVRCAILAGFTFKAAAGPLPGEHGAAKLGRQAHTVIDEPGPVYKKTKRVIPDTHVLHERQPSSWARRWEPATRAPSDAILPMRIGLKQRNVDGGHNKLMAISDPSSSEYGKHMTSEEVIAFFAPHRTTVEVVVDWLTTAGIHIDRISQSANRQWIQFDATVSEAEDLLMTDYHIYKHVESGASDLAAENYHVPAHVQEHIDYVTPGIRLRRDVDKSHDLHRRQQIGADDSPVNDTDSEIPNGTYPISRLIDGAIADVDAKDAGDEATIDFQASMPLIYPQKTVLYQVDDERIEVNMTKGGPYYGFINTFFDAIDGSYCSFSAFGETGNCVMPDCLDPSYPDDAPGGYKGKLQCGVYKPTNVISISYGGDEMGLPKNYQERQCVEIMKLGLQGVTVIVATGDHGVASLMGNCLGDGHVFAASRDASCPYVLAVGSTQLYDSETTTPEGKPIFTEKATSLFGSGGGFSNYFPQPEYQAKAVERYFNTTELPFTGYTQLGNDSYGHDGNGVYHIGGRGYPDVSAIGLSYLFFVRGDWSLIGGTSLAAPLWGAVLTLINEERIAHHKRPVGFVNPVLYAHPEVFNDVTLGSNPGCDSDGFLAAEGWDPVTGLGTPNYPKLLDLFMQLP